MSTVRKTITEFKGENCTVSQNALNKMHFFKEQRILYFHDKAILSYKKCCLILMNLFIYLWILDSSDGMKQILIQNCVQLKLLSMTLLQKI